MDASNELHFMTAGQLLALMNRREVSCVELVRLFIGRCKAINPRLNAVVTLAEERALLEAAESDRRRMRNEAVGRWRGCPSRSRIRFQPKACAPPPAPVSWPTTFHSAMRPRWPICAPPALS